MRKLKTKHLLSLIPMLAIMAISYFGCGISAPIIVSITVTPTTVVVGNSATLTCTASSESGRPLSFTWSKSGGALSSTAGSSVVWTAPYTTGDFVISVDVNDGANSVNANITIPVTTDSTSTLAPVINSVTPTPTTAYVGQTVSIDCNATIKTAGTLKYQWTATGGTLIQSAGNPISWRAPATTSEALTLTVRVTDSLNSLYDEQTISMVVDDYQPPNITAALTATPASISTSESTNVSVSVKGSDPQGLPLTYTFTSFKKIGGDPGGTFSNSSITEASGTAVSTTWYKPTTVGSSTDYTIQVVLTNNHKSTTALYNVTVNP